jgi:hypothetical protein
MKFYSMGDAVISGIVLALGALCLGALLWSFTDAIELRPVTCINSHQEVRRVGTTTWTVDICDKTQPRYSLLDYILDSTLRR